MNSDSQSVHSDSQSVISSLASYPSTSSYPSSSASSYHPIRVGSESSYGHSTQSSDDTGDNNRYVPLQMYNKVAADRDDIHDKLLSMKDNYDTLLDKCM